MLLGFKRQFESFVVDGSKTHTIRAKRKIRPRVGETRHCYGDVRQRTMHLLRRSPCIKVEDIRIRLDVPDVDGGIPLYMLYGFEGYPWFVRIWIEGVELDRNERNWLAWADGFRPPRSKSAFSEMVRFWLETHGRAKRLDFSGDLIHWNPAIHFAALDAPRRNRSAT